MESRRRNRKYVQTDPVEFLQLPSSGQGQVGGRAPQPGGGDKAGVCRPLGDDGGGESQVEGGGVGSPSEDAAGGGEGHAGERGRTGRSPPTVSWKGQNDLSEMVNFKSELYHFSVLNP